MNAIPFDTTTELKSLGVTLKLLERSDFSAFLKLQRPQSMWRYFTQDLSIDSELLLWLNNAIQAWNERQRVPFSIKVDNKIVGSTSLGNYSIRDNRIEIGWTWIAPGHQGKGANDRSKFLLCEYVFESLNIQRVEIKTDVTNTFSCAALDRMGFVPEGVLRSHTQVTFGRRRDSIYYSLLRPEWSHFQDNFKSRFQ
ncbi:MAG: GNAT family N-acetyltransferase [Flavobacteriales bacterium]|nr:GNAT family N-acetyltransferase [Flavobacteriales bacterium]